MITKKCTISGNEFTITESDLEFYAKMEIISSEDHEKLKSREITDCVGLPTLCPEERQRRRLAWRNERKLYQRRCDLCEKMMISIYHNETKFPVYCQDCWWGDNWEAQEFSRDFDFSRPFLDQFRELMREVPEFSLLINKPSMENSDYCNCAGYLKNCYLVYNANNSEQCIYGKGINRCFDCFDCLKIYDCQACYECINCNNCSFSTYSQNCYNSDEIHFCLDCLGCNHCFGCVNLRNKEFYFLNKKYSCKEYEKKVVEFIKNYSMENLREKFSDFAKKFPKKYIQEKQTEDSSGNYIKNCINSFECYDSEGLEDCKYCSDIKKGEGVSFNSYDISFFGDSINNSYEALSTGYSVNEILFSINVFGGNNNNYSLSCMNNCQNLFGCIGLKHAQYCILNKQYTKEEYFKTREKIIAHMKKTGEWGEFFPIELSPFAYNETVAQEYFPLTKEEILAKNWKYREEKQSFKYDGPKYEIPAKIEDVDDEILSKILTCEATGKYYKIQKAELNFYRKMNLPIPRLCPDERHKRRIALRNPRQLFSRECAECKKEIQTTFAPDRPEKVLCEECYLKEVN